MGGGGVGNAVILVLPPLLFVLSISTHQVVNSKERACDAIDAV